MNIEVFLLVESLLNGKENSIIAVALHLLGHHISQELWRCLCMENWIVAEASLLIGAFLVMGQDVSAHVQDLLNSSSAGFCFLKVWYHRVFLIYLL